jgi:hypothetical protein
MATSTRRTLGLLLALFLGVRSNAVASTPDAGDLKARADASFDGRHYAEALAQYQAALAEGADPRIRYNIAQTLTALERYPEALASYQAFLAEAPRGTLSAAQQEKFFALLDELKSKISRLEIRCEVSGALVLLRDKALTTTPVEGPISVNAGPAKIEVIAEGFKPFVAEVDLVGGLTQTVNVALERVDFSGKLAVESLGVTASVSVDGVDRGETPLVTRLEHGAHFISLKAKGYVDQGREVSIEPGERAALSFTLTRSPDYTVAYAGFAAGFLGVATGSVTGILAFTTLASAKAQCDDSNKECGPTGQPDLQTSKNYGLVSSIAFGVGAAGVGLGIYGWLTARHDRAQPGTPVAVVMGPGKIELRGSF